MFFLFALALSKQDDNKCAACRHVFKSYRTLESKNEASFDNLLDYEEEICNLTDPEVKKYCHQIIQHNATYILQSIKDHTTLPNCCCNLSYCEHVADQSFVEAISSLWNMRNKLAKDTEDEITTLVNKAKGMIGIAKDEGSKILDKAKSIVEEQKKKISNKEIKRPKQPPANDKESIPQIEKEL